MTLIVSRSRTTHPQSPPITIGGNVLKDPHALDILGVIFDSNTTFEKNLRSVSISASQRLGILNRVFHDRLLLGRCYSGFCPARFGVLFCRVVLGCRYWIVWSVVLVFQQGVCLNVTLHIVDLWQYYVCCIRSGAIRSHGSVGVTRGVLVSHRYTNAPPRCRTSQHRRTLSSVSVSVELCC